MLWVFAPIKKEEEAKTILLPKIIDPDTFQYPHGLTPPMHYARKRRFRKRISRTAIEAVEDSVEKLLEANAQAITTRWEMINPDVGSRRTSRAFSSEGSEGVNDVGRGEYSEHEDTEEEVEDRSYFGNIHCTGHVQISMPCEPYSQDLALQVDIFRVCGMRSSLRNGRKFFEYLVDMFGLDSRTWTTEDQLRISLSPRLVAELKGN